ncbi:luciferase family oxidoreductase group 1 [Tumebacillus sp. BK434]|uniref:LLM class flavin-dependent oxidoreductase n=1 Tax=Tumebacillus sp. BK434 TaxID=2512169 RepID=UPI00104D85BD|nr:LLM class flavin-dependent oxidoreductase [Tumebacillus sp. BK434]TCP52616.1 luciferase family oxidoreductase group 1 [Tumebacillus sp. BK434]
MQLRELPYSVLDLAPIVAGSNATQAFSNSLDLAQHTERWGYTRYWLAEHHNMTGIASSATSVLIGHIAGGTSTIRVGSGGIMLPNHAPLMIAEQFGTLESLYPGRIDLGLGRAPGSDQPAMRAIRRGLNSNGEDFPELVEELRAYLHPPVPPEQMPVRAVPGEGLNIPIWLLGSSAFSAQLAGMLGLPFAFASHFSPRFTLPALDLYRRSFQPSEVLDEPYAMVGLNVVAADSDAEARRLATSMYQQFLNLVRNRPGQLQPPVDNMDDLWTDYEKDMVKQQLGSSIVGGPERVKEKLQAFLDKTQANEFMINAQIYDHGARLRSFEIVSEVFKA